MSPTAPFPMFQLRKERTERRTGERGKGRGNVF